MPDWELEDEGIRPSILIHDRDKKFPPTATAATLSHPTSRQVAPWTARGVALHRRHRTESSVSTAPWLYIQSGARQDIAFHLMDRCPRCCRARKVTCFWILIRAALVGMLVQPETVANRGLGRVCVPHTRE